VIQVQPPTLAPHIAPPAVPSVPPVALRATSRPAPPKGATADSLYRQGRRFAEQENFEQALVFYDQALQLDPHNTVALNSRCYAYLRLHEYQRAIADCDEAIRLSPGYANAYTNRAVAKLKLGDRAGANQDFRQATRLGAVAQEQAAAAPGR
jgi:tetratricopeptide (TPR) repeat protein